MDYHVAVVQRNKFRPAGEVAARTVLLCATVMALERIIVENPYTARASFQAAFGGDMGSLTVGGLYRLLPRLLIIFFLIATAFVLEKQIAQPHRIAAGLRLRFVGLALAGMYVLLFIVPTAAGVSPSYTMLLYLGALAWLLGYAASAVALAPSFERSPIAALVTQFGYWSGRSRSLSVAAHMLLVVGCLAVPAAARIKQNNAARVRWEQNARQALSFVANRRKELDSMEARGAMVTSVSDWASARGKELDVLRAELGSATPPPSLRAQAYATESMVDDLGTLLNLIARVAQKDASYTHSEVLRDADQWSEAGARIDAELAEIPESFRPSIIGSFRGLMPPLSEVADRIAADEARSSSAQAFESQFNPWLDRYSASRIQFKKLIEDVEKAPHDDFRFGSSFQATLSERRALADELDRMSAPSEYASVLDGFKQVCRDGIAGVELWYAWYSVRWGLDPKYAQDRYKAASQQNAVTRAHLKELDSQYEAMSKNTGFDFGKYRVGRVQ